MRSRICCSSSSSANAAQVSLLMTPSSTSSSLARSTPGPDRSRTEPSGPNAIREISSSLSPASRRHREMLRPFVRGGALRRGAKGKELALAFGQCRCHERVGAEREVGARERRVMGHHAEHVHRSRRDRIRRSHGVPWAGGFKAASASAISGGHEVGGIGSMRPKRSPRVFPKCAVEAARSRAACSSRWSVALLVDASRMAATSGCARPSPEMPLLALAANDFPS